MAKSRIIFLSAPTAFTLMAAPVSARDIDAENCANIQRHQPADQRVGACSRFNEAIGLYGRYVEAFLHRARVLSAVGEVDLAKADDDEADRLVAAAGR